MNLIWIITLGSFSGIRYVLAVYASEDVDAVNPEELSITMNLEAYYLVESAVL